MAEWLRVRLQPGLRRFDSGPRLSMSQSEWTDEEVEILKEEYPTTSASELSDLLDRSTYSIYSKASRLGLETEMKKYPNRVQGDSSERTCTDCGEVYIYDRTGGTTKECRSCYESRRRRQRKLRLVEEVFNGSCEMCGYNECLSALVFHHTDPEEKSFQMSSDGLLKKWEDIVEEANKCILLCSNCHNQVHCSECDQKT